MLYHTKDERQNPSVVGKPAIAHSLGKLDCPIPSSDRIRTNAILPIVPQQHPPKSVVPPNTTKPSSSSSVISCLSSPSLPLAGICISQFQDLTTLEGCIVGFNSCRMETRSPIFFGYFITITTVARLFQESSSRGTVTDAILGVDSRLPTASYQRCVSPFLHCQSIDYHVLVGIFVWKLEKERLG